MAKKALVSKVEPRGRDNSGYRVVEIVDADQTFETHVNLEWKDCPNEIEMDLYWYDPSTETYKKDPNFTEMPPEQGLAVNEGGSYTEEYVWDWDAEAWTKQPL